MNNNIIKVKINDIIIDERIREEIGNLISLERSIKRFGLMHPIIITPEKVLISGLRRLLSCKNLNWTEIDCIVVNLENEIDRLDFQSQENILRKELSQLEIEKIVNLKMILLKKHEKKEKINKVLNPFKKAIEKITHLFTRK